MKRALLIGAALAVTASIVLATGLTPTLSWTPSLSYTNGVPFTAAEITDYIISYTPKGAPATATKQIHVKPPASAYKFATEFDCGSFDVEVSEVVQSASDPTPILTYATGVQCKPNPPTGAAVQ